MTLAAELRSADTQTLETELPPRPRRSWRWLVGPLQLAVATAAFHLSVLERRQGSATLVALVFLCLVPGSLMVKALALRPAQQMLHLVYAVAGSLTCLLTVALAVRALAAPLHIAHPLSTQPMVVGLDALMALLALVAALRRVPLGLPLPRRVPAATALLLIPLASAAGAEILENRNHAWLVILALTTAGCALLWSFFQAKQGNDGRVMTVLAVCTLSLMWSYSLRSKGLYGFDVQQEYAAARLTAQGLAWNPVAGSSYDAMLSITALPTALWQMTGLSILDTFKILFPIVFSLYPAAIYAISRRWLRPVSALLCTCLLFMTASMAAQMPALGRQEVGLVVFIALLAAAFDRSLPFRSAQALVLWLGAAMVVSHYSTTYVALGAFLLTRIVAGVQRLLRMRPSYRAVVGLPIVLLLIAFCGYWTIGVTHSDQNVTNFANTVSQHGAQILPNGSDNQSLLTKWLSGNVTSNVDPQAYFDSVDDTYAKTHGWLEPYPKAVQAEFKATAAVAPTARPWQPGLAMVRGVVTTAMRQGTNIAITVGAIAMFFLLRRRRLDPELSALAVAMFAMTLMVRLSGSASFAYNPERLAMQSGAVLVVPLGLVAQTARRRLSAIYPAGKRFGFTAETPRRAAGALVFLLLAVIYVDTSGLGQRAEGGAPPGNLSTTGEFAERFHANDQDIAAASWIASTARPALTVFADRYGALAVETREKNSHYGLFPDLAPGTIDERSLVFASTSNILDGRARGTTPDNLVSSTYTFPRTFLNRHKAIVFDTGWARVYG